MKNTKDSLTQGGVSKTLLRFAMPFFLASLLQVLYGVADLVIVGRFSNSQQVAAVSIGSQVMYTIASIMLGLCTGGTILIGQYLGAEKREDTSKAIGGILCLFAVIAVALTAVTLLLCNPIIALMQTPPEAVIPTRQYLWICSLGIPFIVGYNALASIYRGMGNSRAPLLFITAACAVNIGLDLVLVVVFHLGAAGAAAATVAAQGISLLLAFLHIRRPELGLPFVRKDLGFHWNKIRKIISLGLPIALQDGLVNLSFLIIMSIINTMGLTAAASVGVGEKIISFIMLSPHAFAAAIATMTAQNMGANKADRAKKCMWVGIGCSLVPSMLFTVFIQVVPDALPTLFTSDGAVVSVAGQYLRSYSLDCIFVCFVFCMNAFFSGCGHSVFPMVHSLITTFLVRVPMCFFLIQMPWVTLFHIGFAAPLATLLSVIFCLVYLSSGRWKRSIVDAEKLLQP